MVADTLFPLPTPRQGRRAGRKVRPPVSAYPCAPGCAWRSGNRCKPTGLRVKNGDPCSAPSRPATGQRPPRGVQTTIASEGDQHSGRREFVTVGARSGERGRTDGSR